MWLVPTTLECASTEKHPFIFFNQNNVELGSTAIFLHKNHFLQIQNNNTMITKKKF